MSDFPHEIQNYRVTRPISQDIYTKMQKRFCLEITLL